MRLSFICLFIASTLSLSSLAGDPTENTHKPVIGEAANFLINGHVSFRARIDSGATGTSINAHNIIISDASEEMEENKGKQISFDIIDADGKSTVIQSRIERINKVTTPQGVEHRYVVPMTLTWNGKTSIASINLRDRSRMEYKLLIGRDWLDNYAVIDVDPKPTIGEVADYIIDGDLVFTARVDTGATSTSINAINIEIKNSSKNEIDNMGKSISFDIVNNKDERKRITTKIKDVINVNNAIGTESRYQVAMKIEWQGKRQTLDFNLKDRSKLTYKLLIGRDWIGENAIVNTLQDEDK